MQTKYQKHNIGAHLSSSGNICNIFNEANNLDIYSIACFTSPNLQYGEKKRFSEIDIVNFSVQLRAKPYRVFSHGCYLVNLANKTENDKYLRSKDAISAELERCDSLGIIGAVFHPGSFENREVGLNNIVESIEEILENYNGKSILMIESSAGQGSTLPTFLEEIKLIFSKFSHKTKQKVKFTLDTCHMHAAGYDFSKKDSVIKFLDAFEEWVSFDNLGLIHLNDSKHACGSRKDRHESIGLGTIGLDGLELFLNDSRIINIDKILETPITHYMDWKKDLDVLEKILN